MLTHDQQQQAEQALHDFLAAVLEVEYAVFASIAGLAIVATVPISPSVQRLTAASAALLLLGEHATQAWRNDEMEAITVNVRTEDGMRGLYLQAISTTGLVLLVLRDLRWNAEAMPHLHTLTSRLTALAESADGLAGLI